MKTAFRNPSKSGFGNDANKSGFEISDAPEKTYRINHSFSKDILKIGNKSHHRITNQGGSISLVKKMNPDFFS